MSGPLTGLRIVEVGSIGPGPFAAMMLADMGADVIRLDRVRGGVIADLQGGTNNVMHRGRPSVGIDLKTPGGRAVVHRLAEQADGLIEGFRPGVMERLGLGPDELHLRNQRLVYGRMTGYGQTGPMAQHVGHDINYISISGALGTMQRAGEKPMFPCNLLGDFGGGGLLLAFGMACALVEAGTSGLGQVIDASMVDGSAVLATALWGLQAGGMYDPTSPGTNFLDSGAHWYEVYETADSRYISVGALEPEFYAELLGLLGIERTARPQWQDWEAGKEEFAALFRMRSLDEWTRLLDGTDACATPVLRLDEAPDHPHNVARRTFVEAEGIVQPAPAPRFSRTEASLDRGPSPAGADTRTALRDWGFSDPELKELERDGAITCTQDAGA